MIVTKEMLRLHEERRIAECKQEESLRRDAERYRWLRDMLERNDAEAYEIVEFAYRGGLTSAIDAAMNGANDQVQP